MGDGGCAALGWAGVTAGYKNLRLWLKSVLVSAVVLVPFWLFLANDFQKNIAFEQANAELELRGITQVSAQTLLGRLRLVDYFLQRLSDLWFDEPKAFDLAVRRIQQQWGSGGGLYFSVISAKGLVLYSSLNPAAVGLDVSDREPFLLFADSNRSGLRMGQPISTRVEQGKWFVPLSRPLYGASGEFQGVVSILLVPQFLTDLYGTVGLRKDSTVSLIRSDDALILRSTPDAANQGKLLTQLPLPAPAFDAQNNGPRYQDFALPGTLVRDSRYDGVTRLYAWEKLPGFDLALVLGSAQDSEKTTIRLYEQRYFASAVTISVLWFLLVLWRMRLESLRERSLAEQEGQIRALTESRRLLESSKEDLRLLNAKLVNARELEGQRIAQEIHDELGQRMSVLRMDVATLERATRSDFAGKLPTYVQQLKTDIDAILAIVRDITRRLRPASLDLSLHAAIEGLVAEYGKSGALRCELDCDLPPNTVLDDAVKITVFRFVQEALTNVLRHGAASHASIRLSCRDGFLELSVADNGVGFDAAMQNNEGMGLQGMRERVASLGGLLTIDSQTGVGTTIRALFRL